MRLKKLLATAVAALPLVVGYGAVAHADGEHFVFVSHAPDTDSWWNVIKNALKNAAADTKTTVDYRNPATGDIADMARIIQQATATNPDGIITTIADFDVLQSAIQGAVAKGIPVITVNSGTAEQSKQLGALMHIGQPEYDAGKGAGERAKAAGVTDFVCVNHYITNAASVERCQGYADALGVKLGDHMIDSTQDPTQVYNKVKAYLTAHPDTNGILTLGPNSAEPTIKLLRDTGEYDRVWQAGTILLPVQSVGVMGDERTYEYTVALRAVTSVDGMTADWAHLPYEFLAKVSNDIINNVRGINRVVYDISSKPPATIEWE